MGAEEFLGQMVRIANIKEQFLITMALVADFSYGWKIVENFLPLIHRLIQRVCVFGVEEGCFVVRVYDVYDVCVTISNQSIYD